MDNIVSRFLENGQQRRAWLDNIFSRLLPPELESHVNALDMLNPVSDIGRAMSSSRTVFDPNAPTDERIRAGSDMAVDMASVLAPGVGLKMAGKPAANAVVEALAGASGPMDDAAQRFFVDETGALGRASPAAPRNEAEAMARDILDLRAAGRASEVTDDMMAKADPQYMFNNTPLPMDVASRMARAEEMGADPLAGFYHGTAEGGFVDTTDITAFDPARVGDRWNADDRGFSITSSVRDANYYARPSDPGYGPDGARNDNLRGGAVYPLEDLSQKPYYIKPMDQYQGTIGAWDDRAADTYEKMDAAGADSARIYSDGVEMRVVMDPTNLRSRFARFDPEFRHLRNLSAGIGGLAVGGALSGGQNGDRNDKLAEYGF